MNSERYHTLPECGWPCRLDPDDETKQTVDLNDGTTVQKMGDQFVWFDLEGCEMERFDKGDGDYEAWDEILTKLIQIAGN